VAHVPECRNRVSVLHSPKAGVDQLSEDRNPGHWYAGIEKWKISILDIDLFFGWGVYSATNEGGTPLAALCFALVISFLWDEYWGLNGTVFCLGYEGFGSLLFDN